jgi:hypothetical protein
LTFVIAMIRPGERVWFGCDQRVTKPGDPPDDEAAKFLHITTPEATALLGFCGLAEDPTQHRPMIDYITDVLAGANRSVRDHMIHLAVTFNAEINTSVWKDEELSVIAVAVYHGQKPCTPIGNSPGEGWTPMTLHGGQHPADGMPFTITVTPDPDAPLPPAEPPPPPDPALQKTMFYEVSNRGRENGQWIVRPDFGFIEHEETEPMVRAIGSGAWTVDQSDGMKLQKAIAKKPRHPLEYHKLMAAIIRRTSRRDQRTSARSFTADMDWPGAPVYSVYHRTGSDGPIETTDHMNWLVNGIDGRLIRKLMLEQIQKLNDAPADEGDGPSNS